MLTVADELAIAAMDDDTRALVERYAAAQGSAPTPRKTELLYAYQAGWRDALEAIRKAEPVLLPGKLPERFYRRSA